MRYDRRARPGGRPKVLLLGKVPPPYFGPAVATQILLDSALTERYEVLHVDTNVHRSVATIGRLSPGKVGKNLAIYARLLRVLRRHRPDVVLVPISQTTVGFLKDAPFILLARRYARRTMIQLRGSDIQNWLARASAATRAFVAAVLRRADGVVVLGRTLRPLFADYFPEARIFVVPNGADYDLPAPRPRDPARRGEVALLYLANLQPSKGIEDVLAAVALLAERGVAGFTLDVVGAWPDAETERRCRALVHERGLPVVFHGPAYDADKLRFLVEADAFVFTPREPEGHPWVLVEALAAGLPVVSTDQGAIVDSVLDGTNGFIVATRSPEAIADRLTRLIGDPALRARFAEASRRHYEAHFTEGRMVEQLSAALDQLMAAPRMPASVSAPTPRLEAAGA